MTEGSADIQLRPREPADEDFLTELYQAQRRPEFAPLPVAEEVKREIIHWQYGLMNTAYATEFGGSGYDIVLVNGKPVGRIWVCRRENEILLVDIVLAPDQCNRGVGTRLVTQLTAESAAIGKPLRSTVSKTNPGSFRFHRRLGFQVEGENESDFFMVWNAQAAMPTQPR